MLQRKPLVLCTPEWKTVPWRDVPKDLKDVLVDILVDMPDLLQDLDRSGSCDDAAGQNANNFKLVQKCWDYDRQLQHWLSLVWQESQGPCNAPPLPPPNPPSPGQTPDDWERHLAVIHGMSLYWAICLVLYSALRTASGSQERQNLPERTDPERYVRKLVEAISILLRPTAGLYGYQSAAPLIELTLRYTTVVSMSPEHERLLDMRKRGCKGGKVLVEPARVGYMGARLEERSPPGRP